MEVPVEINGRVVEWLSSMGYPVEGMSRERMQSTLIREARQWQMSPYRLTAWINEGAGESASSGVESRHSILQDVQSTHRSALYAGA